MAGSPGVSQGLPDGQQDPEGKRQVATVLWSESLARHPLSSRSQIYYLASDQLASSGIMQVIQNPVGFKPWALSQSWHIRVAVHSSQGSWPSDLGMGLVIFLILGSLTF